jgi:predicted transcriptional regulator of viral defense system
MADRVHPPVHQGPRARLAAVLSQAQQLVRAEDVMTALSVDRTTAGKTLARWHAQRWLQRVGHGLYAPIPLDARATEQVLEDPWVLVPPLFDAAYIGGWTAAEHWDLTEQLFRSIFVFTTKAIRVRKHDVHGITFVLRHIPPQALFGTRSVWRGQAKVQVSDIHRTIVDMFADPAVGGGIRHVADCFTAYLKHKDANPETLIQYAEKLGNGAVFKRMGFLAETLPDQEELAEACRARLTQGNAKLDPGLPSPRLVRAWRLWIPETWLETRRARKERRP